MKPLLLYALHSGQLYGTERMSLATAAGLLNDFEPVIFAPQGPALDEARRLGLSTVRFTSTAVLARKSRSFFTAGRPVACVATAVPQSVVFWAWSSLYGTAARHVHVVHGGADEASSYGRKRWLLSLPVEFVAVSSYVRDRLRAHGIPVSRAFVIENFLTPETVAVAPRRPPFANPGIQSVAVVSRVDPIKRVELLLDALAAVPALNSLSFDIFGSGWDLEPLRRRAAPYRSVTFHGFVPDVPARLARADLLLHLCPTEPFGLAVLEAAAADVPALVPASGGAGDLVTPDVSGFTFAPDDPRALAAELCRLSTLDASALNRVTAAARHALSTRFSPAARIADYRRLLAFTAERKAA